ncbi:hypothetical protein [Streptomyces sp. NPDC051665]|uniref:hypothetical protein n=1 Tax=Streptomyces sp. NPDC051665 TaxID=3154647 RepID=UPI00341C6F81
MRNGDYLLNTTHRDHLLALIAKSPGRTLDEHEAEAEKVTERLMIRTGLPSLVQACQVRRDDNGRLWPLT